MIYLDWTNINRDRDTSGLGPIEYDQTKVPPLVRKYADNVRTKTYGQQNRESIARTSEYTGLIASESNNIAKTAESVSKDTQNRFNDQISKTTNSDEVIDARRPEGGIAFNTLNERLKANIPFVTYAMFGANGDPKFYNQADGKYYLDEGFTNEYTHDDGVEIKLAHEYANANKLNVINTGGDYVIKGTRNIPVKTSVDVGMSNFHIDETYGGTYDEVFEILSDYSEFNLDSSTFSEILPYLKKGTLDIPPLGAYKNHFVIVTDTTRKVGMRQGAGISGSWDMQDFFYIDEGGSVVGEVTWNFTNITSIVAVKCDESYLEFNGGNYLLSGTLNLGELTYKRNGFRTNRSRTRIKTNFVGLDGSADDIATAPSSGFYFFDNCYDVSLNDIKLLPRKNIIINGGNVGSYGIGGTRVIKLTLDNVTANAADGYWGVMGSNLIKDLNVKNSELSRIDVHFHAWNVSIDNTKVGKKGINLTGGGTLNITRTTVDGWTYVNFRGDYGSTWNGDINIDDATLRINGDGSPNILYFSPSGTADYGYPVIYGHRVIVENFTFDFSAKPNNDQEALLVRYGLARKTGTERIALPEFMSFKNVTTTREKGVRLLDIQTPSEFRTHEKSSYVLKTGFNNIKPNATYIFENVKTTSTPTSTYADDSILLNTAADKTYEDAYSLVPEIRVNNGKWLSIVTLATICKLVVDNSTVNSIIAMTGSKGNTKGIINNSEIRADGEFPTTSAFVITFADFRFNNVDIFPFISSGVVNMDMTIKKLGILEMPYDKIRVFGFHNGTRLAPELISHLDSNYPTKTNALLAELNKSTNVKHGLFVEI